MFVVSYAEEYHIELFTNLIDTVMNWLFRECQSNVIEICEEVAELVKTDILELRRPYFAENHDDVDRPLFVVVSMEGVAFFTDVFSNTVFFYCQNPLVR